MGTLTPLILGTNGGMGVECQTIFLRALTEKLEKKTGECYADTMTYKRTKLSFEIIKSVNLCIRGFRTPFHKNKESDFLFDFTLNTNPANIS